MQLGTSLFLIAVGAIARFAVSDRINGVDLGMVGTILMCVGAIGLVLALLVFSRADAPIDREYRDPRL